MVNVKAELYVHEKSQWKDRHEGKTFFKFPRNIINIWMKQYCWGVIKSDHLFMDYILSKMQLNIEIDLTITDILH